MKNQLNIGTRIAYLWKNKQKTGTINMMLTATVYVVICDDQKHHYIYESNIIGVIV